MVAAQGLDFRGKTHTWLRNFLANRRQRVVVNDSSSSWSPILSVVPEGTLLGPTLFLLFVNDVPDRVASGIKMFADDCINGVYISCSLNWSKQCAEVKKKATKILGVIQRNLSSCSKAVKQRAYLSLVRPTLEYATPAWSPHTKKDIYNIESVYRRAVLPHEQYNRNARVSSLALASRLPRG